ncbi:hypothetical protein FBQ95_16880 [Chloroflexi bacterium CFX3]|nr:hypothetical protein [Chloroflexi bacterium CFX3]
MDDILNRRRRGMGCMLIFVLVFLCVGSSILALDRVCVSALSWRVPVHPESVITRQRHNFLTANGMGQSVTTYFVPGAPREIDAWYNRQVGEKLNALGRSPELSFYYNITSVAKNVGFAEDGVNTQLIVIAHCLSSRAE